MADIPNKTVADKVLHGWRHDYRKHIEGNPARPIPEELFLDYQIKNLTRSGFLYMISDAIEERLEDFKNGAET